MSINMDLIKKKLTNLQTATAKGSNDIWKLSPGKYTVRIVPYKFNKDNPFIELYVHYNLSARSYVSPQTYGKTDPIVEFADKLRLSGEKEDFKMAGKLRPKLRIYAPVIIRGSEGDGCKFWGFSQTTYQDLLSYIADPDYGDITDPVNGRDLIVEVKSPEETGRQFTSITVKVKPNVSPITNSKEVLEKIFNSQKKVEELFPETSYEDLKIVLDKWLNPEGSEEEANEVVETKEVEEEKPKKKPAISTVKTQKTESVESVEDAFNSLFNNG